MITERGKSERTIARLKYAGIKPMHFTPREESILQLAMKGYTDKEIAQELTVTTQTVKTYLKYLYQREGFNNKCHAVAVYLKGEWKCEN